MLSEGIISSLELSNQKCINIIGCVLVLFLTPGFLQQRMQSARRWPCCFIRHRDWCNTLKSLTLHRFCQSGSMGPTIFESSEGLVSSRYWNVLCVYICVFPWFKNRCLLNVLYKAWNTFYLCWEALINPKHKYRV